jgi:hypothetical protein
LTAVPLPEVEQPRAVYRRELVAVVNAAIIAEVPLGLFAAAAVIHTARDRRKPRGT